MGMKMSPTVRCTNEAQRNDRHGVTRDGHPPPQVAAARAPRWGEGPAFMGMSCRDPCDLGPGLLCRERPASKQVDSRDGRTGQGRPRLPRHVPTTESPGHRASVSSLHLLSKHACLAFVQKRIIHASPAAIVASDLTAKQYPVLPARGGGEGAGPNR